MSLNFRIGEIAGTILRHIADRSVSPLELKASIVEAPHLIDFALGWLAKEDRVEIFEENCELGVRRKEPRP